MFDEGSPLRPRSPYAASKAAADLLARAYGITYGLPVWIVRGTNAFGPRQNPEKAIPVFTTAALEGRPLPVYDDGRQSRECLYVTDWAARLHHRAASRRTRRRLQHRRRLRAGERRTWPVRSARLAGADESLVTFVPDRPGHDLRYGVATRASARTRLASRGAVRRGAGANGRVVPGHIADWVRRRCGRGPAHEAGRQLVVTGAGGAGPGVPRADAGAPRGARVRPRGARHR